MSLKCTIEKEFRNRVINNRWRRKKTQDNPVQLEDPVETHLHHLCEEDRIVIGSRRPAVKYDLLPDDIKSYRFRIEFDMEYPHSRFVIFHQVNNMRFSDLGTCEKRELMRTTLSFVRRFKFFGAFLVIPLGSCDQVGTVYSTFYAYLSVMDVELYLKIFKNATKSKTIPQWPSNSWVTPLWIQGSNPELNPWCYLDSVRRNSDAFPNTECDLLIQRYITSYCPPWDVKSRVKSEDQCEDFNIIIHTTDNKVGVFSDKFIFDRINELERCQFLDFMEKTVRAFLKTYDSRRCWMKVSLGSTMMFQLNAKIFAFLEFERKIPKFMFTMESRQTLTDAD